MLSESKHPGKLEFGGVFIQKFAAKFNIFRAFGVSQIVVVEEFVAFFAGKVAA